jgi:hypothetical protein
MTMMNGTADFEFGGPAHYRIVVQGALDPSYTDRLAGMSITTAEEDVRPSRTILVGQLRDQAELSGVLDTLYGLHLPIVEVTKIEAQSENPTTEK